MTRSWVVLIGWVILTLGTGGLYLRALVGQTMIDLGPFHIGLWDSVELGIDPEGSDSWGAHFYSWHPRGRKPDLGWGSFSSYTNGSHRNVEMPRWFPYFIASSLLYVFWARSRERENRLRKEAFKE